jgi:DNA-directed RNA polymerase specialized sigma24 family protein
MEVDPNRPAYVVGGEVGVEPTCAMVPFPEEAEAEAAEAKLPVDVMEELVARLLTLPQELRDVVCWRFMGLEYKEIARKQRITTAGAEARHDRAMRLFPELRQLFIVKTARQKMRQPTGTVVGCGV